MKILWSMVSKAFFKHININITPIIGLLSILTARATVRSLRQGHKCAIKWSKAGMTVGQKIVVIRYL